MTNLQPLFCSILDKSKTLTKIQFRIHIVTFAIAVSTIFLSGKELFAACVLIGISELLALYFKFSASSQKDLGQEILRANMLKVAFGRQSNFSISYLSSRVPLSAWSECSQHENNDYYANVEAEEGKKRLVSVLQESCFWSQHLYGKCASSRFKWVVIFGFVLFFVGVSYSVYMPNDQAFSAPRIFILLISLVPLWNEIEKIIAWNSASNKLKEVDLRLESISINDDSDIFGLYADYNVVTAQAALIPQKIYESESTVLNGLWLQRQGT